ncbi:peptide deformylase [Fervidobacterium nodosum]|uniref:Peptide deformylase n=1 Tax=Fervidobacterium nodosum (strain ATCC 35602 / DSM 5306 / Rt17-B1) TaxID=381764 RepID=A7HLM1_FERNB|nr:peptide deformylase [Fervidobacterium nodosum]ABS60804.1 peptide deformylase [Fervidobacterium nodosum Rt17-B1]PHJ14335.1 peptide deformylase [Fervidobacterium sp. SC_NGM5_G05]
MTVRILGDPVLRKKAQPVTDFAQVRAIIEEFKLTMYEQDGVGLAAPQVGISLRFFGMDDGSGFKMIVNPEIIEKSEEKELGEEGCLSVPGVFADVLRHKWIRVRYQDEHGTYHEELLEGYPARIFQHEYDHLDGVLFIDHLDSKTRTALAQQLKKIMEESRKNKESKGKK